MGPVIKTPEPATVRRLLSGALVGLLTAAVALGVAELAAALISASSAPVIAVGETAINLTPIPVKEFAITHFGSHDKEALLAGIVVMLIGFAAVIGIAAVRRVAYGLAGLAVFAVIGVSAAIHLPTATLVDVIPTLAGVAVGAVAMVMLTRAVWEAYPSAAPAPAAPAPAALAPAPGPVSAQDVPDAGPYLGDLVPPVARPAGTQGPGLVAGTPDRRRFLITGAGAAAVAAIAGGTGDKLLGRFSIASSRAQIRLPAPAIRAAAVPGGTELRIPGLTPFFTSNAAFYRVDTDLVLPQVSPDNWTLKIDGMVDRELEFSFAELLKMPLTEADITLVCVSNQVGGSYNGNARWLGVPLAGLLRKAGG